jgi:hypothetical protein
MRKWIPIVLIALAVAIYAAINIGSSMALNDLVARPPQALVREDERVPVQSPGEVPEEDKAFVVGMKGVLFGYQIIFAMPKGTQISCWQRFTRLDCSNGWQPERAP